MASAGGAAIKDVIVSQRVLPVVRLSTAPVPAEVVEILVEEGYECLEIALTTPQVFSSIRELVGRYGGDLAIGAGSAVNADMARLAVRAGARFVACHALCPPMVETCRQLDVLPIPGVMTATEALQAWHLGADLVKVFPARLMGPGYLEELRRPLPWQKLVAMGGITAENAASFLAAGAAAVAVGHWLVKDEDVWAQDWAGVRSRARELRSAVGG
ncbi:MAG: bifunctional 4-hydroxy-2-oxoglutarate aldolase/2-dehydro-3-deoxy-phosphogluconate aldolase [Armatimonadetes bacterium]|nr:bifunctional 4-hydroxy-2-oxoglutarate aldolase/2-dehydro-3-deoxy-phosphogluconate aldolase [Armatimonadota bacterium]